MTGMCNNIVFMLHAMGKRASIILEMAFEIPRVWHDLSDEFGEALVI